MTTKSFRNFMGAMQKGHVKPQAQLSYDELLKDRYIIVGSPETVRNQIGEYCDDVGAGGLIMGGSSVGPMPNWMVMKNMQIFAEEIMPEFREADGKPDYLREEPLAPRTRTEFAAQYGNRPLHRNRLRRADRTPCGASAGGYRFVDVNFCRAISNENPAT